MQHSYNHIYNNIRITPLEKENIEDMRVLRNKNKHCFVFSGIITPEAQEKWYESYLIKSNDYVFSVYFDDTWIGVCSIYNVTENEAEFGRLLIDKSKTNEKHLGLDATLCACNFAFNTFGIKKIHLQVYEANVPAYKTYIKAGFTPCSKTFDSNGQKLINMELHK